MADPLILDGTYRGPPHMTLEEFESLPHDLDDKKLNRRWGSWGLSTKHMMLCLFHEGKLIHGILVSNLIFNDLMALVSALFRAGFTKDHATEQKNARDFMQAVLDMLQGVPYEGEESTSRDYATDYLKKRYQTGE